MHATPTSYALLYTRTRVCVLCVCATYACMQLVLECAGREAWLPIEGSASMVYKNLGYEDMEQLEDALGGTFLQFIDALPHMEHKVQDDGSSLDGQEVFRTQPFEPFGRACMCQHPCCDSLSIRNE